MEEGVSATRDFPVEPLCPCVSVVVVSNKSLTTEGLLDIPKRNFFALVHDPCLSGAPRSVY